MKYTFIIFLLPFFGLSIVGYAQTVDSTDCVIENDQFRSELYYGHHRIENRVFLHKESGANLLKADTVPYFSVVVNKQLITANMPIWHYKGHSLRSLENGGTELKIQFSASRLAKGLLVTIYRQWFPGTLLLREKLELSTTGSAMQLHKQQGLMHLEFPAYAFTQNAATATACLRETRIASFAEEVLPIDNPAATYDDRKYDGTRTFNLAHCHMFHPKQSLFYLSDSVPKTLKGPMATINNGRHHMFFSYEHASQDKAWTSERHIAADGAALSNDQQQGVDAISGLPFEDSSLHFIGLHFLVRDGTLHYHQSILRGGYLDGEHFSNKKPYQTVWSAIGFSNDEKSSRSLIHNYLWSYITEHSASRKPHYYYNTWGMQRDNRNTVGLYDIFTEKRILQEIESAAQLGAELFVLDDGWEEKMGEWKPNSKRLPDGLSPLIDAIKGHGMIPGIWISPMGIDSTSNRYQTLKHMVIRDANGRPIKAQWDHPAFDFVSSFKDTLLADCKKLIDQGIRFFKWDAINTFNSSLTGLDHGDNRYSKEEVRDRYAYLLPFYVTAAMRELREYNPDVVVELDLTEKERCMVGLLPLQEGKFFWMNNGASGYNDYGYHRSKSMRTVINRFAGILPTELFTQAVYPHNSYPFFAQRYNVNTTLVGGRGFWGNLSLMDSSQRQRVCKTISISKRILPQVVHFPLESHGRVGASPEWYLHLNREMAVGQLMAFSGSACETTIKVGMNHFNNLAVLRHAFHWNNDSLELNMQFMRPDDSREVFILSNHGSGIGIESSDGWLEDVQLDTTSKVLDITAGVSCRLLVRYPMGVEFLVKASGEKMEPENRNKYFNFFQIYLEAGEKMRLRW